MVWIRLWISCIAFLSVAGSISFGLTRLVLAGGSYGEIPEIIQAVLGSPRFTLSVEK